jgi:hypothetical protein
MPYKQNKPISEKEEVRRNPDAKIDQDFNGYPSGPASDSSINPATPEEGKTAGLNKKDGEKRIIQPGERRSLDEQDADGSANAFDEK